MSFKSEIRQSTINNLLEKVAARGYGRYLYQLTLVRVRGFKDQTVTFDFPVTAIVGPNGGGKTTVLGAAGCAYKAVKPRRFFAKSGKLDTSMQDWQIDYQLVDKQLKPKDLVQRQATFSRYKWYRDSLSRDVAIFGVNRTVPANERKELQRCISAKFSVTAQNQTLFGPEVNKAVGRILGKDVSAFTRIKVDPKGRITLLSGMTAGGVGYSEFHFGAGESSIIRMVMELELLPEGSLVLIEEIENGLHPVATVRMVEYLVDLAERKKIQTVFSTHSNDALLPLPSKAIWAAIDGTVLQGKLDIQSLRALSGYVSARLAVFTEDEFARTWVLAALRAHKKIANDLVEVHYLGGDGNAVKVHSVHNQDPTAKFKSVCIIDGDSEQKENAEKLIFRLPGAAPETHIFGRVVDVLDAQKGLLTVSLRSAFTDQDSVAKVVKDVQLTNHDSHLLFAQVAERLGFLSASAVQDAFLFVWGVAYPDEVEKIAGAVANALPPGSIPKQ